MGKSDVCVYVFYYILSQLDIVAKTDSVSNKPKWTLTMHSLRKLKFLVLFVMTGLVFCLAVNLLISVTRSS